MSHVKVDAKRVQQACENFLAKRNRRIEKERDELVKKYVGKRKYWLFGSRYTYETAKQMLIDEEPLHLFNKWEMIAWRGGAQASAVEDLLSLAKLGDPVTLTTDDVWIMEHENV